MTEKPHAEQQAEGSPRPQDSAPQRAEGVGRALFLVAGGILLATLVSCACGPVR